MIELEIVADVAIVTLNAPDKLNAVDEQALEDLSQAYTDAHDAGVRALMLRGEGRAFCAGRDISNVNPLEDDVLGFLDDKVGSLMTKMSEFPAPTFAAAQGATLGVGLGLLIATDVVYVANNAKIGSPFANLGATLDSGGHALFYERLGAHRTLDLIYSAELISGEEAVRSGLFSRSYPLEELDEATLKAAKHAARGATQAFLASKQLVRELRDERLGLWQSLSHENRAQAALCDTADYREGFLAFQEKREPKFTGKG